MSREDVEVVRELFAATNRRDANAARPLLAPDIEWDTSRFPFPDLAGIYRGPDEVLFRWWVPYFEAWEESRFEILELIEAGDELVVSVRASGRGRDGIEVRASFVSVMTVRGGKLVRNRVYPDRDEALEAVGVRE